MDRIEIGLLMFVGSLVLIACRMTVAGAMLLAGGLGYAGLVGWAPLMNTMKTMTYSKFSSYSLSVLPFFLLMGEFATKGGMNTRLFRAARAWVGHWRGGLAMATIGGCASFGAVCGSSIATAATMSQVALPEMRKFGYSPALSTGTLAAGGTLGILIPPSIILVIYAIYTEQSVGELFAAAIVPGLIAVVQYMVVVGLYTRFVKGAAPQLEKASWRERIEATLQIWPIAIVFALIIAGIYRGWFSPTEAAAVGAAATLVLAVVQGGMRWKGFLEAVYSAGALTAMMMLIMLSAELFAAALALSQLPAEISKWVVGLDVGPYTILLFIILIYLVLGCFMESLAMVLLTLPVFVPVMMSLDFGVPSDAVLVWFGILVLMSVEIGMITPPFGLNLIVINSMAKDVPMKETYRGVLGFVAMDIIRVLLVLFLPILCLWMPGLM